MMHKPAQAAETLYKKQRLVKKLQTHLYKYALREVNFRISEFFNFLSWKCSVCSLQRNQAGKQSEVRDYNHNKWTNTSKYTTQPKALVGPRKISLGKLVEEDKNRTVQPAEFGVNHTGEAAGAFTHQMLRTQNPTAQRKQKLYYNWRELQTASLVLVPFWMPRALFKKFTHFMSSNICFFDGYCQLQNHSSCRHERHCLPASTENRAEARSPLCSQKGRC